MSTGVTPDEIHEGFVPRPSPVVGSVYLDGEAVLLRGGTAEVHHLNSTGALIWQCLDGQATLRELVDDISDAYQADRAAVAEDVLGVVRQLGSLGLLAGVALANSAADASGNGRSSAHVAERAGHPEPRYIGVPPSS